MAGRNFTGTNCSHGGANLSGDCGDRPLPRVAADVWVEVTFYVVIFLLAVVGNLLVIITLTKNKRMRTITNVFLLNLAVSDLLLAVFCMPFTLIPMVLENFIFGEVMCVMLRYMQATSVGVNSFTLVAISLERYFAICQPLRSRRWQTLSHAYKIIAGVWVAALVFVVPIAVFNRLIKIRTGAKACREIWPNQYLEGAYQILLDATLFLLPLFIMMIAYAIISRRLWLGIEYDLKISNGSTLNTNNGKRNKEELRKMIDEDQATSSTGSSSLQLVKLSKSSDRHRAKQSAHVYHSLQQSNYEKSLKNKKRVIKMLFVVVLDYFICWTPLYVVHTWMIFDYSTVSAVLSPMAWSFIRLLSYVSVCCNPITYCFMNSRFRQGFVATVKRCCFWSRDPETDGRHVTDVTFTKGPSSSNVSYLATQPQ